MPKDNVNREATLRKTLFEKNELIVTLYDEIDRLRDQLILAEENFNCACEGCCQYNDIQTIEQDYNRILKYGFASLINKCVRERVVLDEFDTESKTWKEFDFSSVDPDKRFIQEISAEDAEMLIELEIKKREIKK